MTALQKPTLPDDIRNEIARLKLAGFHPVPLGGGEAGKAPLIRNWTDPKLTLAQVLAPMFRTGSAVYGLRLEGLAVIDVDDDSPDLVAAMEARFGPSPVHVKTPRGRHLHYRAAYIRHLGAELARMTRETCSGLQGGRAKSLECSDQGPTDKLPCHKP